MLRIHKELRSPSNPAVKAFMRLVRSRRRREDEGKAPVFGNRLLCECVLRPGLVQEAFVTERALSDPQLEQLLAHHGEDIEINLCSERVLERMGGEDGAAFLVRLPHEQLAQQPSIPSRLRRLLVLDGVRDPGNAGMLIRTAHVLGWHAVFLLGGCVDAFSPKVSRASSGSVFDVAVVSRER